MSDKPQVDRKATSGWGSTPKDRHYINHEQALKVLQAGIKRAEEIWYVAEQPVHELRSIRLGRTMYG
jgi:hypothetical protein